MVPQLRRQPEPYESEAADGEQRDRRGPRPQRVVDRRDADDVRVDRDGERREGAGRDERERPQAGGAAPRARAWRTRWTNTGFPSR